MEFNILYRSIGSLNFSPAFHFLPVLPVPTVFSDEVAHVPYFVTFCKDLTSGYLGSLIVYPGLGMSSHSLR